MTKINMRKMKQKQTGTARPNEAGGWAGLLQAGGQYALTLTRGANAGSYQLALLLSGM